MYARLTVSGEMPSCLPSDCVEGSEDLGFSLPLLIESFICRNTCAFSVSSVLRLTQIDSFATDVPLRIVCCLSMVLCGSTPRQQRLMISHLRVGTGASVDKTRR